MIWEIKNILDLNLTPISLGLISLAVDSPIPKIPPPFRAPPIPPITLDALLIDQTRNPIIKRVGIKLTIFDLKLNFKKKLLIK
jgi:hypothetical protein